MFLSKVGEIVVNLKQSLRNALNELETEYMSLKALQTLDFGHMVRMETAFEELSREIEKLD